MWEYGLEDLDRYVKMIPKADYSCLEVFLRSIEDEGLFSLQSAGLDIQKGVAKPSDQIFVIAILGKIFVNEYEQKSFSKEDYLKLFPIFMTSVYYEALHRHKKDIPRISGWRELKPSHIQNYRNHNEVIKQIHE